MTKRGGRKRQIYRDRYENGKPIPERDTSPALIKRVIDAAMRDARNPWLGSAIGQLRIAGVVTDNQTDAGIKFCELVAAYDRMKGIPNRHAKSPSYQSGMGGISLVEPPTDEEVRKVEARYQAARSALNGTFELVMGLTVYDRTPVGEREVYFTRLGLDKLAAFFGLTR